MEVNKKQVSAIHTYCPVEDASTHQAADSCEARDVHPTHSKVIQSGYAYEI